MVMPFEEYVRRRLSQMQGQGAASPAPPVTTAQDIRFLEQNTQLPAPPRAFPSPHTPKIGRAHV